MGESSGDDNVQTNCKFGGRHTPDFTCLRSEPGESFQGSGQQPTNGRQEEGQSRCREGVQGRTPQHS